MAPKNVRAERLPRPSSCQPFRLPVSRVLSPEQVAEYQPWFDNQKRLRALVHELEELSLSIIDADPAPQTALTRTGPAVDSPWYRTLNP